MEKRVSDLGMFTHSISTYPKLLAVLQETARDYCRISRLPLIAVISDRGQLPAGVRAAFDFKTVKILVSRQLIDLIANEPNSAKVWSVLSALRHELNHYEQYLKGAKLKSDFSENEPYLVGKLWADTKLASMSTEDINPIVDNNPILSQLSPGSRFSFHGKKGTVLPNHRPWGKTVRVPVKLGPVVDTLPGDIKVNPDAPEIEYRRLLIARLKKLDPWAWPVYLTTRDLEKRVLEMERKAKMKMPVKKNVHPYITPESKRVFEMYARDAVNWGGTPLVGGNVGGSKEERGNLTQLKKAGLITTQVSEGDTWISFTDEGIEYAKSLGIDIYRRNPLLSTLRPGATFSFHGKRGTVLRNHRPWGAVDLVPVKLGGVVGSLPGDIRVR